MGDDQQTPDGDHKAAEKTVADVRLEGLQKTLHLIEATNHILEVSGIRPEPLKVTLRNLERLLDKGHSQVRAALALMQESE
jgi:hypothetical protein